MQEGGAFFAAMGIPPLDAATAGSGSAQEGASPTRRRAREPPARAGRDFVIGSPGPVDEEQAGGQAERPHPAMLRKLSEHVVRLGGMVNDLSSEPRTASLSMSELQLGNS